MAFISRLILLLSFFTTSVAHASSPLALMWRNLTFENENGDVVTMKVRDGALIHVDVTLKGRRIPLPREALDGVSTPVLNEVNLYYESGFVGDQVVSSVVLQVPIIGPGFHGKEETGSSRHFQFVFRGGRLVERILQVHKDSFWEAVEVKIFNGIEGVNIK